AIRKLARQPRLLEHASNDEWHPRPALEALWDATARLSSPKHNVRGRLISNFLPASLRAIVACCPWLRHCRDDAAHLSEPEWFAMLSIAGRCVDGARVAHEWSAPTPDTRQRKPTRRFGMPSKQPVHELAKTSDIRSAESRTAPSADGGGRSRARSFSGETSGHP